MSLVKWATTSHIEGFGVTLCGRDIPLRKEWNAFGKATCKACLKAESKAKTEEEYAARQIEGQCPFNAKKSFTVNPINTNKFTISQFIAGVWQSDVIADLYRTSEIAYIDQDKLVELAKR
jgi:hypothetical protein